MFRFNYNNIEINTIIHKYFMQKIFLKSKTFTFVPKNKHYYKRINHSALLFNNHILLFGGTDQNDNLLHQIIRIDCDSIESIKLPTFNQAARQGSQIYLFRDNFYLWGGLNLKKVQNDMWKFDGTKFEKVDQLGQIPSQREDYRSILIDSRYLLIYGGYSPERIFNDWFIFDTNTFQWKCCQIIGDRTKPLYKPSLTWLSGRAYLFGGQIINNTQLPIFANDLYQIQIRSFQKALIQITKLSNQNFPSQRAGHVSLNYKNRYLIIIGGQGYCNNSKLQTKPYELYLKKDVWIFDSELLKWIQLNLSITPRFGFTAQINKTKIYIIGGAKNLHQLCQEIQIIYLNQDTKVDKICSVCKTTFALFPSEQSEKKVINNSKLSNVSLEFVQGIAQLIKSPFNAFALLIDNSFNMGATLIKIVMKQKQKPMSQEKFKYLEYTDNSRAFNEQQFISALFNFNIRRNLIAQGKDKEEISIQTQYGINLKLGAFRLGACLLFISKNQSNIYVGFLSYSELYMPNKSSFFCYHYNINSQGLSKQANYHRKIILDNVKHIISQEQIKQTDITKKIIIFELKKVQEGQKIVYQLKDSDLDIKLKSIQKYSKNIEISLRTYISYLYLHPYIGRSIFLQNNSIDFINYEDLLKKFKKNDKINTLKSEQFIQSLCKKVLLYSVPQDQIELNQLQGLLIYHDNRLFLKYDGESNEQNQIVKKHKVGIIEIPHQIRMNILKTGIQGNNESENLKKIIKKVYKIQQNLKRKGQTLISNGRKIIKQR